MLLDHRNYLNDPFDPCEHLSFEDYLNEQTDNLLFFLEDAAANENHPIRRRLDGAAEAEVEAELRRWRDRQVRRFCSRLRLEREQDRSHRLMRRLRRERDLRVQVEDQLQATEAELHRAKDELAVERDLTASLKEVWYCRDCTARRWY
jgi:hypothetical protein